VRCGDTLAGLPLTVKAAHMKLSHSRMPFVRVYFRETQELVFDAHDKAFQFYGGVCRRGIYDNMKTAVEAIFVGKPPTSRRDQLRLNRRRRRRGLGNAQSDAAATPPTHARQNSGADTPLRIPYGNKEVALKLGAALWRGGMVRAAWS
jgi:hypothetical protein